MFGSSKKYTQNDADQERQEYEKQKRYYEEFREEERRREQEERESRESEAQRQQRERDRLYAMGPQDLMVETAMLTKELLRRVEKLESEIDEIYDIATTLQHGPSEDAYILEEIENIWNAVTSDY